MTKWKNIGTFLLAALPWALLILAIIFGILKYEGEKRANQNITALQGEISHYKNKVGGLTATVGMLQLTKRQLEQQVLTKDDSLKKLVSEFSRVSSIVKTEMLLQIDSIDVVYQDPVPFEFYREGTKTNKWYSFDYESDQFGFKERNFKTWTEATSITGFKRKWFLGRQYATTDITLTNPHITTTHIQAVDVVVPVKWHETRLFNIGVGLLAGALIFAQ